jgi:hypothetical protein
MTFTYHVSHVGAEYTAECVEIEAMGVGPTLEAAVESLRKLIAERVRRPEAVGPPSRPPVDAIELVRTATSSPPPD